LTDDGITALSVPIADSGLPKLTNLGLSNNANVSGTGTVSLIEAVVEGAPTITSLGLEGNNIESLVKNASDSAFEILLFASPNLTSVNVAGNDLADELPVLANLVSGALDSESGLEIAVGEQTAGPGEADALINLQQMNQTLQSQTEGRCSYAADRRIRCSQKSEWFDKLPDEAQARVNAKINGLKAKHASKMQAVAAKRDGKKEERKTRKLQLDMLRKERFDRLSASVEGMNRGRSAKWAESVASAIDEETKNRIRAGKKGVPNATMDLTISYIASNGRTVSNGNGNGNGNGNSNSGNSNGNGNGNSGNTGANTNVGDDDTTVDATTNGNANNGNGNGNSNNGNGNGRFKGRRL